jgi:FMN-dependent NADH-azoreductase
MNILRIDSSPLQEASASRQLLNVLQSKLESQGHSVTGNRDLYYDELVTLGTQDRYAAYFTPAEQQSDAQKKEVAGSNELAAEFAAADAYIIGAPMYNFSVTAALKTYIDLIARAGISFNYTEEGPVGLLKNKKAYVIVSTGGTPVGSEVDFVSTYLTTLLGFLGITDVTFIAADLTSVSRDASIEKATKEIEALS